MNVFVLPFCICLPLTIVRRPSECGSAISWRSARYGPTGAAVSKILPAIHWLLDGRDRLGAGRASFEKLARGGRDERACDLPRPDHAACGQRRRDARREIDDSIALERPQARNLAVGGKADELHG